ncbi:hypothetical protein OG689_41540 [Kitasatospora sp. NBC_00240]|uniref:hypothetical protein n=1 Tax=Kitasatospora sp. NBC_00240 TaxID=2903567 RepID=UPI002255852D|nr:hypothetical protein [Kitasatospora sp. NBC_00240]MCX5215641.1 hypothetical protein [Kitasatospora sp. NBC_00240]
MTSEAPPRNDDPSGTASPGPPCGWCEAPLPPSAKGRPRAYCDLSCKSKAARRRLAARPKPPAPKPPAPEAPAAPAAAAVALPPGVLAAAAEDEPAGPRRRVLELADALAGAAYWYARTLDARDPAQALTGLRSAVQAFTEQLLEAAQAAHDDALAARAPRPAAHLDAAPGHLDTPEVHLDGPAFSDRRFEIATPADGTTAAVPAPAGTATATLRSRAAGAPAGHLDAFPGHLDTPAPDLDGPAFSDRRFEIMQPAGGTTGRFPGPAGWTTRPGTAPGPGPAPTPGPDTERFENRPQPTEAELEEARRILTSPQVLARVSPQLRNDTAPARAAAVPQTDTRPAPALAAPASASAAPAPAAPRNPYERGFGDCDILLALPQLGAGWELAGWKSNALAYFVLHDGEIVGWVEIGIGAVPRWAAITDGRILTDTDTGEPLFHASPELAARTVRQAHLARRGGRRA